ncbi:MAG TPA: M56 family metallopeptidase, partial [Xanthobacteraceae bacterium]|nr:M56 family metallopeptidase [Xanthobacteraceae bacterium]
MLALLLESALRSLLLGAAVWLGLKLLRVKNPHAQMTAWTLVLVASLAMPGLMRLVTVTLPAAPPAPLAQIIWPAPAPAAIERLPQPERPIRSDPRAAADAAASAPPVAAAPAARRAVDWRAVAMAVYALVGGMLLARLIVGLLLTWRLARAARPVRASWTAGVDVRVSDVVGVPVTFGSTILLPAEYVGWSTAKRRAVFTHERAHVRHGDFYVLLLAALNRAVFWFNPFAWWQFVRLAELAEIISDDAALEALEDRPRYAGILLDVAGRRQHAPAALAMARPATVRRRVERILAAREAPARADWRQRLAVVGALLPLVATCAVTIAHGTPPAEPAPAAAAARDESSADLARYAGFYQAGPRAVLTIATEGARLSAQITGQPRFELARADDTDYVSATPPVRVSFVFDGEAPASALVVHQNDHKWRAQRIDAGKAAAIEARFTARFAAAPDRFREQAPTPGSRAAALRLIEHLQQSTPVDEQMDAQLGEAVRLQLPQLRTMLVALGPLQSLFFRGVGPFGFDLYAAQFANGSADFRLGLAADGT